MNKPVPGSFGGRLRPVVVALLFAIPAAAMPAPASARADAAQAAAPHAATTSFHFDNIPVRSALQLIAEEGGFNLVVSDSVQGTITLRLADVTWEQALEVVLRMKGLGYRIDRGASTLTVTGG
jgi:type IV pilus assembly protein PilQ